MIKLDYKGFKISNEEYIVKCEGRIEGKRGEIIMEMDAVLETFEDQAPKEFSEALDIFLTKRGC